MQAPAQDMADAEESSNNNPLIVIVSNRGPFSFTQSEDGTFSSKRGEGGLVTALSALAQKHEVIWVANALSPDDRAWADAQGDTPQPVEGIRLNLITPDEEHYDRFYNVFSNPLLWFIHHELWEIPRQPSITEETWKAWRSYEIINQAFAETIADIIKGANRPVIVFPQDYHLYLVPDYLRELVGESVQIQPFIHIPWPGPDAWRILPKGMRNRILTGLLASNRIGFQTEKDAFNFIQTCRFYLDSAHTYGSRSSIEYDGRRVEAKAYPISIDVDKVRAIAGDETTRTLRSQFRQQLGERKLLLRVDRVEPSKNIIRGFQAFRWLLESYPEYRGKVQMLALLVPSRMEVDQYQDYLKDIMAEVAMINAEYSEALWEPVRVILGGNYHRAIAAMSIYDALLVNPVADGMNLVAKEGAIANENEGVIILSEYAGAYAEMHECALAISPFDIYGTAEAMNEALTMPRDERAKRASALREIVEANGVRNWFYQQVEDAQSAKKEGF
ncbi:MAG: trehalose-6-phosphate synthase [Chloroflexi bacterium]|nr:trehalose-6-phosphate synthase [Chloroflexota bacterium]